MDLSVKVDLRVKVERKGKEKKKENRIDFLVWLIQVYSTIYLKHEHL